MNVRLVLALAVLSCLALAQGKHLGVKPDTEVNEEVAKALYALSNNPEAFTESDDLSSLTSEGQSETDLEAQDLIDRELSDLEAALDKLAENPPSSSETHHRSKRTIGFLSRLGNCIMTFMQNPSCFSRLTRAQIRREEMRQKEMEMERLKTEQEMFATLKSVNASTAGSNASSFSMMTQKTRMTTMAPAATTMRPMARMFQSVRNSLGLLFPRLFGGLRQPAGFSDPATPASSNGISRFYVTNTV